MRSRFGRDLTSGSIPRHMLTFSVPMLAGSFLQTSYSFINAIWVGQYLGTSALAAVTVSFPLIFVLFAVGMGLTMATSILISQSYGARRMDEVREYVDASILIVGLTAIILTVLGELSARNVLFAMDCPPELLGPAVEYLRVYLISMPFGFGLFLTRSMLQGTGDSKTPLYFQSGSVVFMALLDPILMFGMFGLPKLGLVGVGWAAVIAQVFALFALVIYLRARQSPIMPGVPRLRGLGPAVRKLLAIGLPAAFQQSLVSFGMVFITSIVNGYGQAATAAFGAASRIDQIAFMPTMTLGMAVSTLAGQNIGAGKLDRVREVFNWGVLFSVVITLAITLLAVFAPSWLLRIFVTDAEVIALGSTYLRIVGASYPFFAIVFVSNGIINGAGHTVVTTVFSVISLWMVRAPIAYLLSRHLGSVEGVWYAIALSFIVSLTVSLSYYASGRWRKPVSRLAKRIGADAIGKSEDPAKTFRG